MRLKRLLSNYYGGSKKTENVEENKQDESIDEKKIIKRDIMVKCQGVIIKVFDENMSKFKSREKLNLPAVEFMLETIVL